MGDDYFGSETDTSNPYPSDSYGNESTSEKKTRKRHKFDKDSRSKSYRRKGHRSDVTDDNYSSSETDEIAEDVPSEPIEDDGSPPTENPEWYPPNYVCRKDWGSEEYPEHLYELQLATKVFITYSNSDTCVTTEECKSSMRELQRRDKEEGFIDIKHNFYIGGDGNVYEGRGWLEIPDTPESFEGDEGKLLAISMIGRKGEVPGDLRVKTFQNLVALGREQWLITPHASVTWALRKPLIFEDTPPIATPLETETLQANENIS